MPASSYNCNYDVLSWGGCPVVRRSCGTYRTLNDTSQISRPTLHYHQVSSQQLPCPRQQQTGDGHLHSLSSRWNEQCRLFQLHLSDRKLDCEGRPKNMTPELKLHAADFLSTLRCLSTVDSHQGYRSLTNAFGQVATCVCPTGASRGSDGKCVCGANYVFGGNNADGTLAR